MERSGLRLKEGIDGRRRSYLEIFGKILAIASDGTTKTRIVYSANLNFKVLARNLQFLLDKELLEAFSGNPMGYRTTDKGRLFLDHLKNLTDLIS